MNFFAYVTKDKESSKHYCHVFSVRSRVSGADTHTAFLTFVCGIYLLCFRPYIVFTFFPSIITDYARRKEMLKLIQTVFYLILTRFLFVVHNTACVSFIRGEREMNGKVYELKGLLQDTFYSE